MPVQPKPGRPVKTVKQRAAKPTPSAESDPSSDEALQALTPDYAAGPDMAVKVAQQELAALARLAEKAAGPLAKVGITRLQIESLRRFASRLLFLEGRWQRARASVPLATTDRRRLAEAEALDAKLLAGGRWALRHDPEAQAELGRIAEGSGLIDTTQDLQDLIAFWAAHEKELAATDISRKDLARATELAGMLVTAADKEARHLEAASALDLRNRCFWAADALAKEIREGGRYAYRLQPKLAAKFSSRYRTAINRRAHRKSKAEQPPAPPPA
ncbi:MAG TPA: hypothetical protein PLW65_18120 [Pseudomonadota bacterium]|nr:hypothetical protein [Pseudomonadota bacterium]